MPAARSISRKRFGRHRTGDERVDDRSGQVRRKPEPNDPEDHQGHWSGSCCRHHRQRGGKGRHSYRRDRGQIAWQAPSPNLPKKRQPHWRVEPNRSLKVSTSLADQPVSRVPPMLLIGSNCEGQGRVRHFAFAQGSVTGEKLDFSSVAVPCRKIHGGICRIVPQTRIDQADVLEEVGPVHLGCQAHRRDDIPHRHVRSTKADLRVCDHLLDRGALTVQTIFQPAEKWGLQRI